MMPRSSVAILDDMAFAKELFDKRYFTGHNLTTAYKRSLKEQWCWLNKQLIPLVEELKAREQWEREAARARMLQEASRPLWFEKQEKLRVGR